MSSAPLSPVKQAFLAVQAAQTRIAALEAERTAPIAVVGVGCRFPGEANGGEAFWNLLAGQVDAVSDGLPERWRMTGADHTDAPALTRFAGLVDGPDRFDADFFGISPREAVSMDPQQRLLLEVSWEALELAGIAPTSLYGSSTGVYVGICTSDYSLLRSTARSGDRCTFRLGQRSQRCRGTDLIPAGVAWSEPVDRHRLLVLAGRRSTGPAKPARGECDLAIAGGVNCPRRPEASRTFARRGCSPRTAAASHFLRWRMDLYVGRVVGFWF